MSQSGAAKGLDARSAAAAGDWEAAYAALGTVESPAPEDLALLADAAYRTGRFEAAVAAWERIHAAAMTAGDDERAAEAAVKVALHLLVDSGLLAPVRGWANRAERLLERSDEGAVHAWLAVVRAYERLLSGDLASSRVWAERAVAMGRAHGQAGAVAMGRMAEARRVIFEGDTDRGFELLDESSVALLSGELDSLTSGILYCELLCACHGLAQYDRADEWTSAMERWKREDGIGSMGGRCRVHRAELLRIRGDAEEAEREALMACDELRPYLRLELGWPLTELGRIRLMRGDLDGAEQALMDAHLNGWDPQPHLSLLRLARGDVAGAVSSIRDALERPLNVPSKELPPHTDLRRAPLLEARVEIEIAAGNVGPAREAVAELDRIASAFGSLALKAGAALARARVRLASGDADGAAAEFRESARLWLEVGAPYEAALARIGLAGAYRSSGNEDAAVLELRAAHATLDRVGARPPDEASKVNAPAPIEDTSSDASLFRLEGDTRTIHYAGRTVRLRDLVGLRHLARLLASPGRELHVLDLVAREAGAAGSPAVARTGNAGPMIDEQAKAAYRRRLQDIDEDLEEAERFGEAERAARARAERDFLVRELSRAVGIDGRTRSAGDASERARASVTRAIRLAMARIATHHADLAEHLDATIRTGTYCAYVPDPRVPVVWRF